MIYSCCDARRREAVRAHPSLNGIDFVEVLDRDSPIAALRQRTLLVHLLKPTAGLSGANVVIDGGERIPSVGVAWAGMADSLGSPPLSAAEQAYLGALGETDRLFVVRTEEAGDYSTYVLSLVDAATKSLPPAGFDPLLTRIAFSFKVECPSDFDCLPTAPCAEEVAEEVPINYLAKDYATFRRLMLDRMSQLMPEWRERSPADLGVTLVELLAYVGDHLSYQQDAIATEAYLGTARRRTSVRRHARLVDYAMHDGANARALVQIAVDADGVTLAGTPQQPVQFMTRIPGLAPRIAPPESGPDYRRALAAGPATFEAMHPVTLFQAHNEMHFYTWGDRECCLAKGATRATLKGHLAHLTGSAGGHGAGDIVVFETVLDPRTGRAEDADPLLRHPVRLLEVVTDDAGGGPLRDPLGNAEITEIRWHEDDALPFPMCISAITDPAHGGTLLEDVTVARGNIALVDHGRTVSGEALGVVPEPARIHLPDPAAGPCAHPQAITIPPRFRPALAEGPLTQAAPFEPAAPASAAVPSVPDLRSVRPAITLTGSAGALTATWSAERDLLGSAADDRHFVAEIERDGIARLRFGDDRHGMRPNAGTAFTASYRVGGGPAGNVGAEAIGHVVTAETAVIAVRNPLPARGGTAAESIEAVRQSAPFAFRTQERAVTPDDYAAASVRRPGVQRAAATFRWTGSWHTAFVTVDRLGGRPVDAAFEEEMRSHLEPFRMAGYDLEIDAPRFVPLEVEMTVCAAPDYFRSDVRAALIEVFSNRILASGRRGLFHPDNFSFGEPVYLSTLYAAAHGVAGVERLAITRFQRQGVADRKPLDDGMISLGRLEIARLDNDPNFPERGVLRLTVGGGK